MRLILITILFCFSGCLFAEIEEVEEVLIYEEEEEEAAS